MNQAQLMAASQKDASRDGEGARRTCQHHRAGQRRKRHRDRRDDLRSAREDAIKIGKDAVDPDDIETLEDLVTVAVNDALDKANENAQSRMAPA